MTLSTTANQAVFEGNDSATSFSYAFLIPDSRYVFAYVTDDLGTTTLLTQSQFSITGIGASAGGSVNYPLSGSPLPTGWTLSLLRVVSLQQLSSLRDQGGFFPEVVESALDYVMMGLQQIANQQETLQEEVDNITIGAVTGAQVVSALGYLPVSPDAVAALVAEATTGLLLDVAPTATVDVAAPPQGLSFAVNSVVDIVRMVNSVGSGGNDGAAMQKAINYCAQNGGKMYLRGGTTLRMGPLDFSGVREFWGDGRGASIIQTLGAVSNSLLTFNSATSVGIRNLQVMMDSTAYPSARVILLNNATDVEIENVYMPQAGACAVLLQGANKVTLKNIRVEGYAAIGLLSITSGTKVIFDDCTVENPIGSSATHAMQIQGGGGGHELRSCHTDGAKVFGANFLDVNGGMITGNKLHNGYVEAWNVQDCQNITISNNESIQRRDGAATDFGGSIYGDPTSGNPTKYIHCVGNKIFGSAKSGIALAGNVTASTVAMNHIVSPNVLDEDMGAGVLLYGSGCQRNHVHSNTLIDEGGKMRWGVNEWVGFGDGAPDANYIGQDNRVIVSGGAFLGENNLLGPNSEAWDSDWVVQGNPALTAGTGTISGTTFSGMKYKRRGKTVDFKGVASMATQVDGAGTLDVKLPVTAVGDGGVFTGIEAGVSGKSVRGRAGGDVVEFAFTDNSYPGATGAEIIFSGFYEAQ